MRSGYCRQGESLRYSDTTDDTVKLAALRWSECRIMSRAASTQNLAASVRFIQDHYLRFRDWYEGRLSTQDLINITGVQQIPKAG